MDFMLVDAFNDACLASKCLKILAKDFAGWDNVLFLLLHCATGTCASAQRNCDSDLKHFDALLSNIVDTWARLPTLSLWKTCKDTPALAQRHRALDQTRAKQLALAQVYSGQQTLTCAYLHEPSETETASRHLRGCPRVTAPALYILFHDRARTEGAC